MMENHRFSIDNLASASPSFGEELFLTLILWNSLIYTILKSWKWRHKPSKILFGEYEPQASILCELWLGLWCHFYGFEIV